MRQGQFGPAAEALRAELAAHPKTSWRETRLPRCSTSTARATRRSRSFATYCALKPNYADARYLFGKILLARGSAAKRARPSRGRRRLAPDDANIHYQLGQAYQRLGRAELAAQEFEVFQRLKDKARGGKS